MAQRVANHRWHQRKREVFSPPPADDDPNDLPTGLPHGFDDLPPRLRSDIFKAQARIVAARHLGVHPESLPLVLEEPLPAISRLSCGLDIFEAMTPYPTVLLTVLSYLRPTEILSIYSISKPVKDLIDMHLTSSISFLLQRMSPDGPAYFPWRLYGRLVQPDPSGRTNAFSESNPDPDDPHMQQVRLVPTLKWFHMVADREMYITQIIGLMARAGHRFPKGMATTLKKLWLFNDAATNKVRRGLLTNRQLWTDNDLYHVQMFLVKLPLMFQDPVYGPHTDAFAKFLMGQRGLFDVWAVLFRLKYTTLQGIMEARVRYNYTLSPTQRRLGAARVKVWGVPYDEVGRRHLEGWGEGAVHLMRIDEVLPWESARRGLALHQHLEAFLIWGSFCWRTGRNLIPSAAEMDLATRSVEEEEALLAHVNTTSLLTAHHTRKLQWHSLSYAEREAIRLYDRLEEAEAVRGSRIVQVKRGDLTTPFTQLYWTDVENYDIEWQMQRGWTRRAMTRAAIAHKATQLWRYERQPTITERIELNQLVLSLESDIPATEVIDEDDYLKSLADIEYDDEDLDFDWDQLINTSRTGVGYEGNEVYANYVDENADNDDDNMHVESYAELWQPEEALPEYLEWGSDWDSDSDIDLSGPGDIEGM
ncbi:hypothetical protein BROUX41_001667 [Berkeleyomyces rouxiae]|uniref:uncharacterized protein n=1 Tax=Berkeleyomyces rouxiae TaxID=2035830 RepID=UPI003B7A4D68